jgi:ferredoxin-NADP reductase/Na+-translocating ferredoxin:NAD+ oxidoreductase RnfD subunit
MANPFSLSLQKSTGILDRVNDRFTSYRLVLYYLLAILAWAVIGSFFKQVTYNWHEIILSAAFLTGVCYVVNKAVSVFMDIPANRESWLITALILTLILTPVTDKKSLAAAMAAGIAAMASKYVITLRKSHIFNPAAFGAFIAGRALAVYPSWWIGTKFLTPIVILGGILVLRKVKRFQMAGLFLALYLLYLIFFSSGGGLHLLWVELISTQVLFFAIVMLTEPLTSPATAKFYLIYALIVAVFYSITRLRLSPEEALLVGNVFAFIFAANRRYEVSFIKRIKEAEGIFSYIFSLPPKFSFAAGQYMELTLAQNKSDSRGNRRYLTVSAAPTEPGLMFTVKEPPKPSAFKQRLAGLRPGEKILVSRVAGSLTLPKDHTKKLAFMAGGVGITPFRSMLKDLMDKNQRRDIVLLYSANSPAELSYQSLFQKAATFGFKINYVTDGHIDAPKIQSQIPDYKDRTFYLSGPYGFVNAVETSLLKLGVSYDNIVTDYFPGYGD